MSTQKYNAAAASSSHKPPTIREKQRCSFEFQFLTIDMTITRMIAPSTKAKGKKAAQSDRWSYEVECEVSNVEHLIELAGDEIAFRSAIQMYLQNVASLTHLLSKVKNNLAQN